MSFVVLSVLGTSGLAIAAHRATKFNDQTAHKEAPRKTLAKKFAHTGTYLDFSQVSSISHYPGTFIAEQWDVDLQGVPFRWLEMHNGAIVKCYNDKFQWK